VSKEEKMSTGIPEPIMRVLLPRDDSRWEAEVMSLDAEQAVPVIVGVMFDGGERLAVRKMAVTVLGMLRDARAVGPLTRTLRDPDRIMRARSAEALGEFKDLGADVVALLVEALRDEDYYVRECGAKALGKLRRAETLTALREMSEHDEVSTNRELAQEAVAAIEGGT
jgi:HEAT repeat protein